MAIGQRIHRRGPCTVHVLFASVPYGGVHADHCIVSLSQSLTLILKVTATHHTHTLTHSTHSYAHKHIHSLTHAHTHTPHSTYTFYSHYGVQYLFEKVHTAVQMVTDLLHANYVEKYTIKMLGDAPKEESFYTSTHYQGEEHGEGNRVGEMTIVFTPVSNGCDSVMELRHLPQHR